MKTCKKHIKDPVICYSDCAGCEMQRLTDERNKLKAENERLTAMLAEWDRSPHGKVVLENMELRKDAERYRWLRQYTVDSYGAQGSFESLDRDIDAAMSKESPNG